MSGKFRDKETGVEGYLRASREMEYQIEDERGMPINGSFKTLSELLEKWEEIKEEPKEYWCIEYCGEVSLETDDGMDVDKACKEIGNYFETKEDAEKAVEKLKAWKRLRDKGFKFGGWTRTSRGLEAILEITAKVNDFVIYDDLDILFGGKE